MTDPRDYDLSGLAGYPRPAETPEPETMQKPAHGSVADYQRRLWDLEQREQALRETGDRLAVSWAEIYHENRTMAAREAEHLAGVGDLARAWLWLFGVALLATALLALMAWIVWGGAR